MLRVSLCVRAPCSVCRLTVCLFGARCWGTAAVLRDVARCSAGVLRGLCGCHLRVFCGCSAGVLRGLFGCSAGALWAPFAGVLRVFCGCSEGALRLPFAGVLWVFCGCSAGALWVFCGGSLGAICGCSAGVQASPACSSISSKPNIQSWDSPTFLSCTRDNTFGSV